MAQLLLYNSANVDYRNGTTPRTVPVYTVPAGQQLVLDSAEIITLAQTGSGNQPVITLGNSGSTTAYQQTLLANTFLYLSSTPLIPQIVSADTAITATITTNSTYTTHTGLILLRGYLLPESGQPGNYPPTPSSSGFVSATYTVDPSGAAQAGVILYYSECQVQTGTGVGVDGSTYTVVSDDTGLVQIPSTPGTTISIWSAGTIPTSFPIPADASSPYVLPNFVQEQ